MAGHVEQCPACASALEELDDLLDPLVGKLRNPLEEEPFGTGSLPAELVAVARSARNRLATAAWQAADGPRKLGKFELLKELGAGSFGYVFQARDTELDRTVAIKILREPIHARPIGRIEHLWRWCRRNPLPASLLIAVTLGSAFGLLHLSWLSEHFVRSTALTSAAQQSEMLEVFNDHYSEVYAEVDKWVPPAGKGVMPLPATLTIKMGKHISQCGQSGMQVRLYSDYPFRSRKDGGPQDEFGWEALRHLRQKPEQPFYRFEDSQGRPFLRYATARRMKVTCIECHNRHPDSTNTDWQEGDVRGVLEIIRPLDEDIAQTRKGLRGTFLLMVMISGLLLGLSVLVLVGNRRRSKTPMTE